MAGKSAKRIAITGPESTGKSILSRQLAEYFGEPWAPEYSREYLATLDREYSFYDILKIAKGQYNRELQMLNKAKDYLFCDTDFLVTHIWCKVKYGASHIWIEQMLEEKYYDFTLLCKNDLPWEYDPLRENPNDRDFLFELYLHELKSRSINFSVVDGTGIARLNNAIELLASRGIVRNQ